MNEERDFIYFEKVSMYIDFLLEEEEEEEKGR
jgi:hypothetical protein